MDAAADTTRGLRARYNLSQSDLAAASGISQATISRIESGRHDPSWSTMLALHRALGVDFAGQPLPDTATTIIPARDAAEMIAASLAEHDEDAAIRTLTEAVGRIIAAASRGLRPAPAALLAPRLPADATWRTYIGTAFAYACDAAGITPPAWTDQPRLPRPTVPGDEPSAEFAAWLARRTPRRFLDKNLLTRESDWVLA